MNLPRYGWTALRWLVSVGLVWGLVVWVDWRAIAAGWRAADPWLLAGSAMVLFSSNVLGAFQWHLLLRAMGIDLRLARTLQAYFVGLFFNNFLPSGMGGDVVKVYEVGWREGKAGPVLAATVADRLLGLFVLTGWAVGAAALGDGTSELRRSSLLIWAFFAGLILVGLAIAFPVLFRPFSAALRRVSESLGERVDVLVARLRELRFKPGLLVRLGFLSALIQLARILVHALTGAALGIDLPLSVYLTVVPVLGILVMLPSINGIGIREGGGVLLFAEAGLRADEAVSMQLLTYIVMVSLSLVGGVIFALGRGRRAAVGAPEVDVLPE